MKRKILVQLGFLFFLLTACATNPQSIEPGCLYGVFEVRGESMQELFPNGSTIQVNNCTTPIKGDSIIFNHTGRENPVLKLVQGTAGDELDIQNNTIIVNNKTITTTNGTPYKVYGDRADMIRLYSGTIPNSTYLLLANRPNGGLDSTRFGLIHEEQIIGVVVE